MKTKPKIKAVLVESGHTEPLDAGEEVEIMTIPEVARLIYIRPL